MDSIKTAASVDTGASRRWAWAAYAVALLAVSAIIVAAMLTARIDPAVGGAIRFRPHLPNLDLIARQSPVIQVHIYAAFAVIALGAAMMLSRKGRVFHRIAGWVWVLLMLVVAGSSLFITGLNGDHWSLIHLLAGWTLLATPLGLIAARRHKVMQHRRTMMGLFYGGVLIAGALAFIPGRLMWNVLFG